MKTKFFVRVGLLLLILVVLFAAVQPQTPRIAHAAPPVMLNLEPFASGLTQPVNLTHTGIAGDNRLFVVEELGQIRILNPNGTIRPTPFLDVSEGLPADARIGVYGLAFHPEYETNGTFFIHYIYRVSPQADEIRIARFQVTDNANIADRDSENVILVVLLPGRGHSAGDIHFGPDDYLYIPLGDGNNPVISHVSQDPSNLVGKFARIDVDMAGGNAAECEGSGSGDYTIPANNPFVGTTGTCDEIWGLGLRNPWRFSFDSATGDMYLSDVGEDRFDEWNYIPANSPGGLNFGWPCYEGNEEFMTNGCGPANNYAFPAVVTAIGVDNQCALLGGYVYRGSRFPALAGRYFYADYCAGHFYDAAFESGSWQVNRYDQLAPFGIVSLGEDNDGELYSVNYDTGRIHTIIDGTPEPFADTLYLTPRKATTVGGVTATPSDIVMYDPTTNDWSLFFDGSDVGVGKAIAGFTLLNGGDLLLSFRAAVNLSGLGNVAMQDVVRFTPTSTGANTAGSFAWYLDGSDVGLTKSAEQIDAIAIAPNGRLLISTTDAAMVAGQNGTIKAQDEDLLAFNATNLGANSAGTWALYLDGSTIPGLAAEDLTGAWVDPSNNDHLAVANAFNIAGQQGNGRDIFIARPIGGGSYDILPYWEGAANGFSSPLEDFVVNH